MSDPLAWLIEPFHHGFMCRAALSSVLLGVGASLLGCVLVVKRLTLMSDALAHSLLPGVGIAWFLFGPSLHALLVGGLVAGLVTALGSALISRLTRVKEDVAFGALFIALYGLGVAVVSKAGTPVDLLHFLFGDVLAVTGQDLYFSAVVSSATVLAFAAFYRAILMEAFDPVHFRACNGSGQLVHFGILGLVVLNLVGALHAIGVVLALGLFLLPAATAYLWCERWAGMLALSVALAVVGTLGGLVISYHAGLASGPCMVSLLGAFFLLSAAASPRRGLVARLYRPAHEHIDHDEEHEPVGALAASGEMRVASGETHPDASPAIPKTGSTSP